MIGNALKLIEFLYIQDKDKLYEVKEYKKKRNNNQNSRYWKLINELSLKLRISVEKLHFEMLKNYSQRYEIIMRGNQRLLKMVRSFAYITYILPLTS